MAATQFAADTPLLVAGLVAVGGIFALWRPWIYALAFLLLAFVLAACWRRAGVLTDAELAELRYGGRGAALVFTYAQVLVRSLIMLTALIAALASTVDTHLNWGASYWANDIYKRYLCGWRGVEPSGRSLVWVARLSNVLILAIALAVMARLDSIKLAWELSLLLGAGVGVVLVLRWVWWRITAWGEVAAIGASAVLVPVALALIPEDYAPLRMLLVAAGSTAAAACASLWTAAAEASSLRAFYLKVRPPGFWGPVAREAGMDARAPLVQRARGLGATALCAVTVFGLLIGIGTWLVEATPPARLPHRGTWIALNIGVALAVIPLWVKLGASGEERGLRTED